jgi:peptidoglycan-N-acetylglucosamine deacetylase
VPGFGQQRDTQERWRRFPGLERLTPAAAGLALTFDDGPDPDATPAVLDALDRAGARASFFLVGEQVEAHPALAREVAERSHTVAVHGQRHVEHDALADPRADLERARAVIAEATGVEPRHCRPPYGRFSAASYEACRALGLEPVLWSGWGLDWEPIPAERIVDLVARDLEPGAIIVLHDSARYAPRATARPTAEALAPILATARQRGLEPVLLPAG